MTITHIIFMFNIGGAETMLADIVNEQCKTEDVTLIIIDGSYNQALLASIDKRVKVVMLGRKSGSKSPIPIISLNLMLLRQKPDVIHIHNWQTPRILLPVFKPFFTVHGMGRPSKYYDRLCGIIAISEAVKQDILTRGNFAVNVIPNGVVIESIKQKQNLACHNPFRLVQIGRLKTEVKGQDILVKAVEELRKRGRNVQLDIIGDGESLGEISRLIEDYSLQDCVRLLGPMTRQQLYSSICDYDLLCQPSRKEGFGLTVAEAMAAKVPVLVSNVGGPFEIIEKGKLGYAFHTEDVEECAKSIGEIMDCYGNENMRDKIEASYDKVVSEYSIKKMVTEYKKFYLLSK